MPSPSQGGIIPSAIVIVIAPPPFSFTRNPQNPIYPIRNKFARLIPLPPPVVKQIAKTKAVRAAYLRRMDGGADAGVPEGGKAGDAKSIGVLSK